VAEALRSPPEGRVVVRNVGWETYERLVEEDPDRSAPRFFYDRGELEIVSPSFEHEAIADVTATLVVELAVELEIDVVPARSTTFKREDLSRGFEPDASFYFPGKIPQVRGKRKLSLDAGDPHRTSSSRWTSRAPPRASFPFTPTSKSPRCGDTTANAWRFSGSDSRTPKERGATSSSPRAPCWRR
jgi:hypothetical protein